LLTGKAEQADITLGMEAGADDFISKPFDADELAARINAGLRVLALERRLEEKQRQLEETHAKLEAAYAKISQDIQTAAYLQASLVPGPTLLEGRLRFDALFRPCRFLAGDIYNLLPLNDHQTLCYLIDVSGKGVPAALLSFAVTKLLSTRRSTSIPMHLPDKTADVLNDVFQTRRDAIQYFTMCYAVIDHRARVIRLVVAGHPPAAFLAREGGIRALGEGDSPIGLFSPDRVTYHTLSLDYAPGDRLFLYSDGATEAFDAAQQPFSEERLFALLEAHRDQPLDVCLEAVRTRLAEWTGRNELDDDLTICALEML
jgi:sigma-B regulation protein RsbU (phosphoserine phosphatase)